MKIMFSRQSPNGDTEIADMFYADADADCIIHIFLGLSSNYARTKLSSFLPKKDFLSVYFIILLILDLVSHDKYIFAMFFHTPKSIMHSM